MRSYPRNSPEAAARLLALLLIADGHVCRSEIEALESLDAPATLGLAPGGFARIVQSLCEDLMLSESAGEWPCGPDDATLAALLGEVDEPALRRTVLALASAAAPPRRPIAIWPMPSSACSTPCARAGRSRCRLAPRPRRSWRRHPEPAIRAGRRTPQRPGSISRVTSGCCRPRRDRIT